MYQCMKELYSEPSQNINKKRIEDFDPSLLRKIREIFGENVTETDLRNENVEENEDIFDVFGDQLPKELIETNIRLCIQKKQNLFEALLTFEEIANKREHTWEIDGEERYREEALKTINQLNDAKFQTNLFLGKGNAGHVFSAPGTEDYCIKYLHSPKMQATSIEEEFMLLGQVNIAAEHFKALKIPQAHCFAKNIQKTKNFFTMEKINGLTLEQLVDYPSKREKEYPSLNTERIIEILKDKELRRVLLDDLRILHRSGIIHGDIHPRNIMLGSDGSFFLIDFGNAVVPTNVSVHATYDSVENVKELDLRTFSNSIEKTIKLLEEQVLTK